jgi:hypothetical protein
MMSMLLLVTTPMRCDAIPRECRVAFTFLPRFSSFQAARAYRRVFLSLLSFFFFFFFFFLNETNDYQEDAALRVQCA